VLADGCRDMEFFVGASSPAPAPYGRGSSRRLVGRVGGRRCSRGEVAFGRIPAAVRHEGIGPCPCGPLCCGAQIAARCSYAYVRGRYISPCLWRVPEKPTYSLGPKPPHRCPGPDHSAHSGGDVQTASRLLAGTRWLEERKAGKQD
jgi:hypothetical protein